jgi:hypothetical protein
VSQKVPLSISSLFGIGKGSGGAVNGQDANERQDDDDKPYPFIAFETGSKLWVHGDFAVFDELEVANGFFELTASVFVAIEQIKARAGGRQKHHIALFGHFGRYVHSFFGRACVDDEVYIGLKRLVDFDIV